MKLDTLRILSSHRLLYFSPSTHVNGRLMEYIRRKTEIYIYIYTQSYARIVIINFVIDRASR